MLYPRKNEKHLDKELFKNPSSEYRCAPFWAWNSELKPEILEEQINCFKEMGFGGFHMHPRTGMTAAYLGNEFMNMVKFCTECARKNNMLSELYDEDRWPSGAAGGLLTKDPVYRIRFLEFTKTFIESVSYEEANKTGKPYLLGCYDISLNDEGELSGYSLVSASDKPKGDKWYAYVKTPNPSLWMNYQTLADTLNKETVDEFIKLTHESYYNTLGEEFGKTVRLIFSDEPNLHKRTLFNFSKGEDAAQMPWTMRFPEKFTEYSGLDIVKKLPELFWELPEGKVSKVRYCFYDFVAELFARSFNDNVGDWCEKHGLLSTGHVTVEATLDWQCEQNGETMRQYRNMQIPGIDMVCNNLELSTAKQCQSVVHQYDREGMMTELYGVTDWDFDFRCHKFQGDWQAALGATYRVPHLSWVSMKGESKRDYPASIGYQSPWFREYRYIEDHFARVNTALTRGKPFCRVAVIHPIETSWINCGPNDKTIDIRKQRDLMHSNLTEWLLFGLIDFDFISESLLPSQYQETETGFKVGEMKYDTILVPSLQTIRSSTLKALEKFRNKGGRIIFAGQLPSLVDAEPSNKACCFAHSCEKVLFDKISILKALESERIIEIRDETGSRTSNLIYNMRQDGEDSWLFIANAIGEGWESGEGWKEKAVPKNLISNNHSVCQNLKIEIAGEFEPVLFDTLTGEIKEVSYEINSGKTTIPWKRHFHDSLLLNLRRPKRTSLVVKEATFVGEEIRLPYAVKYTREEPNVLLLDIAEYSLDGEAFNPEEEILKLDNICREKLCLRMRLADCPQPWVMEKEKIEHYVTLRFHFESEIEVKNVLLALENAENSEITLNGEKVKSEVTGYYVDHAIDTVKLTKIKIGENILEIKVPFGDTTDIENCFILGEFNVRLKGRKATIVEMEDTIGFGDISKQGMPFYSGNITYHIPFTTESDGKINIRANHYKGALLKLYIDKKEGGIVAFDPYTVTTDNLEKGEHTLDVQVFGNRYNTFGALHTILPDNWVASGYYKSTDYGWSYEYANIRETGLLSSPVIMVEKENPITYFAWTGIFPHYYN